MHRALNDAIFDPEPDRAVDLDLEISVLVENILEFGVLLVLPSPILAASCGSQSSQFGSKLSRGVRNLLSTFIFMMSKRLIRQTVQNWSKHNPSVPKPLAQPVGFEGSTKTCRNPGPNIVPLASNLLAHIWVTPLPHGIQRSLLNLSCPFVLACTKTLRQDMGRVVTKM